MSDPVISSSVPGTLEHLDPNTVQIGENVRDAVDLSKGFLGSLREHGVLVPLTAVRGADGIVRIRNGQRRTLGAHEIGLATVPVYVLPATAADDTDEAVERIVHQIVTNDHKDDLTDVQRAHGIQQMIDAGLSATKVAKPVGVARHRESRHHRRRISHRHGCTVLGPTDPHRGGGHHRVHCYVDTRSRRMSDDRGGLRP